MDINGLPLYYVYQVTNKITGQFYIGSRSSHIKKFRSPDQDLLIYYFTSSYAMGKDIKASPDLYKGKVLFRSNETVIVAGVVTSIAYWYEQLIIKHNITNPMCTNEHYVDPDTELKSFNVGVGKRMSEEFKQNLRRPKSEETKQRMRKPKLGGRLRGRRHLSEDTKQRYRELMLDRLSESDEYRMKLSVAKQGKPLSDEHKQKIKEGIARSSKRHGRPPKSEPTEVSS